MGYAASYAEIVEDGYLGFSKGDPARDGEFWVRDNANCRDGTGNFSLVLRQGREEIVVGSGYQDAYTGEWTCTVLAPYNAETDSDVVVVGKSDSRFLCKCYLWKARGRAFIQQEEW